MPVNKNALIRYKTIDKCLQNRYRKWTLEDLVDKVSEAIYEYEGKENPVGRRTVQADIQAMRSDKLGYNAPIIVKDRKYYTYEDADYSITNIPLTENDLGQMTAAVELLQQFKGFSHFDRLNEVVKKLEDHIYSASTSASPVIDFEKNELLKGIGYLDTIHQAIVHRKTLRIRYQSFTARRPGEFTVHAWWLKEFKNRWFAVGVKEDQAGIVTLALDRMLDISIDNQTPYRENDTGLTPETYYKDVIGVTVSRSLRPTKVVIYITQQHAPYVLTKPLHQSQKLIEGHTHGVTIEIIVQHNLELEREILSYGDGMIVLQPNRLRNIIMNRINKMKEMYGLTPDFGEHQIIEK